VETSAARVFAWIDPTTGGSDSESRDFDDAVLRTEKRASKSRPPAGLLKLRAILPNTTFASRIPA
jgi:hypothetical protein